MIKVELLKEGTTLDPIMSMALAASNCYDSKPTPELVRRVLESGHTSIAEFAVFHFKITGVSRAMTHQLVRKRIGSGYAQRSQRYVDESNFAVVVPDSIAMNKEAMQKYNDIMVEINKCYKELIKLNIPKEDARYVLPNAITTVIDTTINLRSLMELAAERLCTRSQWEIRNVILKMKNEVVSKWPMLGEFIKPKCQVLGYCPEHNSCGLMVKKKDVEGLFEHAKEKL